ncbi:hypothetical protein NDI76_08190 [Halogeometricum sp. S1BR25-6]|uniref:Uncharacterized protein n=1 Tax=Halogeometricum salsisoli TaxID=2950536 RepID=A0ABU2GD29_9EURY|nr:hypothetical protein [Halogeometricum sp. S1BR25-6]MDS0298720.1 hypothetical protein [Halogeometricum sp. S1BR25-6]
MRPRDAVRRAAVDGPAADGAEILDGDRSEGGLPDGTEGGDDAVIIDGAEADTDIDVDTDADAGDGAEMVFGGDVRDPDGDAA